MIIVSENINNTKDLRLVIDDEKAQSIHVYVYVLIAFKLGINYSV